MSLVVAGDASFQGFVLGLLRQICTCYEIELSQGTVVFGDATSACCCSAPLGCSLISDLMAAVRHVPGHQVGEVLRQHVQQRRDRCVHQSVRDRNGLRGQEVANRGVSSCTRCSTPGSTVIPVI